ncbi:MAG: hypothetical protein AB8U35_02450 [Rickettsia aeschlimannii]
MEKRVLLYWVLYVIVTITLVVSCDNCKKAIKQQKHTEEEAKRRILIDTFLYKNIKAPPIEELTLKDAFIFIKCSRTFCF